MKKNFPTSWPYLNEHGVSFSKKDIDEYAEYLFDRFKPKSKEFGLEMAYLILWMLDHAFHKTGIRGLLTILFARTMSRGTFETRSSFRGDPDIPDQVDESVVRDFALLEHRLMFEVLAENEYHIEAILEEDRRKRHAIVKRLQARHKRMEEKYRGG